MTAQSTQPQPGASKVVPIPTRPAQASPAKSTSPGQLTPISTVESHPADEPGYGHGV
jgi:hypothetical protein